MAEMQKAAAYPLSLRPLIRYIPDMPDDKRDASLPAEYALGLVRGDQRRVAEDRLASDAAMGAEVAGWQSRLAGLDDEGEAVPPGSFEKILGRIDESGMHLPGTATKRAAGAAWQQYSDGIVFRVLKVDEARGRQTLLVKMQPGAIYKSHSHDVDEECLVIEGDLRYGDLVLRAGDYHLAEPGTHHPTGTTTAGCLLHVVVGMDI